MTAQTTLPAAAHMHRWRAFTVLAVSYFMTIVDLTIVNVALPTIGRKLHFSESNVQWVVTAYALTFGGFLLLGGRAADLLGRRRILMVGLGLFTAASLGAGLATSAGFLIAMRALQGLGAAVVLPAALSIVTNMFSEGADRNKALGAWGAIGGSAATAGLILGGLVTRYVGWQYIFFLYVPAGAVALLLARRVVPGRRLAGHLAHLGRAGGAVAEARHPHLAWPGDGNRDGADRRRHPVGDAGASARALLGLAGRPVLRRRRRRRLQLHPDLDRRPHRR